MQVVKHVVIAAAGLGSRLGLGKPKCLVEINGQPILEYQLQLLASVPDVRIVVGFEEHEVIRTAQRLRRDVTFVRNPAFRTTTTQHSYALGARHLCEPCLFLDGDIIFDPDSFASFINHCSPLEPLVGVTASKTTDAVYAKVAGTHVTGFSREHASEFEWANIVWLPANYFSEATEGPVFERLTPDLPIRARTVTSYEVDTAEDFALASRFVREQRSFHAEER